MLAVSSVFGSLSIAGTSKLRGLYAVSARRQVPRPIEIAIGRGAKSGSRPDFDSDPDFAR
jgi:hypothetical protein